MIGIIDYGVGNLKNVKTAVDKLGYDCIISSKVDELKNSLGLILPGVGAFGDSIEMFNKSGLRDFTDQWAADNGFILGICVGMQLLFERSYEMGVFNGLGYLKGEVVAFEKPLKIPHMGWNQLEIVKENNITSNVKNGDYVYFVHSYYAKTDEKDLVAYTDYGVKAAAIVNKNNIYGMQFHPEKSAETGAILLKNYLELIK